MPDDVKNRRVRRSRLEIRDWALRIGVRPEVLREAVYAVGTDPAKVDIYLKVRKGDRWAASH